jgi:hypothetical protein
LRQGTWTVLAALGLAVSLPAPPAAAVHGTPQPLFLPPLPPDLRASADGTALGYETDQTDFGDTDAAMDVYLRTPAGGGLFQTQRVSVGPAGGNGPFDADLVAVSEDGSRVVFQTSERLVPGDDDFDSRDVYEWAGGTTTLLSVGPEGGTEPLDAGFAGATADGTRVFFRSGEHLVPGDEDTCFAGQPDERPCFDLYERAGGVTQLVSTGPNAAATQDQDATFLDASADGARVFFETQQSLVTEDADGGGTSIGPFDIYERAGGTTSLVSTSALNPNQPWDAEYGDASEDGTRVFFRTQEQLTGDDTDGGYDIFERSGGQTTRISRGSLNSNTGAHAKFHGITPDGAHVFFDTPEKLEPEDVDVEKGDLYRRSGSATELVSTGPLAVTQPSDFLSSSLDGQHVYFTSVGRFTPDDTDTRQDIYERFAGTTKKLSPGNLDGPFDHVRFEGASRDGTRVLFIDTDGAKLYEYWNDRRWDVSTTGAAFDGLTVSADASVVYFLGNHPSTGGSWVILVARIDGAYPRPKGATPMKVSLVPAYEPCTAPNREHGPPLAFASCNPPALASDHLTVGTAESNGRPTKSEGRVRLVALPGAPGTPADEADVVVGLSITDVRRRADLADYTGGVRATIPIRVTDRDNAPAPGGLSQGTGVDADVAFDAACAATADTTVGATCETTTSIDALMPGAVKEGMRTVWQLGQVRVDDGGADSDPSTTGDNTLFAVQGVFAP